jgi:hypothetical protein
MLGRSGYGKNSRDVHQGNTIMSVLLRHRSGSNTNCGVHVEIKEKSSIDELRGLEKLGSYPTSRGTRTGNVLIRPRFHCQL